MMRSWERRPDIRLPRGAARRTTLRFCDARRSCGAARAFFASRSAIASPECFCSALTSCLSETCSRTSPRARLSTMYRSNSRGSRSAQARASSAAHTRPKLMPSRLSRRTQRRPAQDDDASSTRRSACVTCSRRASVSLGTEALKLMSLGTEALKRSVCVCVGFLL